MFEKGCLCAHVAHAAQPSRPSTSTPCVSPDPIALQVLHELQTRGMTMIRLSEETSVNRSVLCRWLSGTRSIRVRDAIKVMAYLGIVVGSERDFRGQEDQARRNDRTKP